MIIEYLSQGLSNRSILLRHKSYMGTSHYYNDFLNLNYDLTISILVRNYINLIRFSLFTNQLSSAIKVPIRRRFLLIIALPLGLIFYLKDESACKN